MSINDLPDYWRSAGADIQPPDMGAGLENAADHVDELRSGAWHPVIEPPTEADADEGGDVLVRYDQDSQNFGCLEVVQWYEVGNPSGRDGDHWARIRDVVLLPPEEP